MPPRLARCDPPLPSVCKCSRLYTSDAADAPAPVESEGRRSPCTCAPIHVRQAVSTRAHCQAGRWCCTVRKTCPLAQGSKDGQHHPGIQTCSRILRCQRSLSNCCVRLDRHARRLSSLRCGSSPARMAAAELRAVGASEEACSTAYLKKRQTLERRTCDAVSAHWAFDTINDRCRHEYWRTHCVALRGGQDGFVYFEGRMPIIVDRIANTLCT